MLIPCSSLAHPSLKGYHQHNYLPVSTFTISTLSLINVEYAHNTPAAALKERAVVPNNKAISVKIKNRESGRKYSFDQQRIMGINKESMGRVGHARLDICQFDFKQNIARCISIVTRHFRHHHRRKKEKE